MDSPAEFAQLPLRLGDQLQWRYCSREAAMVGHQHACRIANGHEDPDA